MAFVTRPALLPVDFGFAPAPPQTLQPNNQVSPPPKKKSLKKTPKKSTKGKPSKGKNTNGKKTKAKTTQKKAPRKLLWKL